MDILDFFRGTRTWRQLAALIRGLPPRSRLALAQADDDELAEAYLAHYGDKTPTPPPALTEYSPEAQRLDRLTVATEALFKLVASALKAKTNLPPPPRTPVTAVTRARERVREERMSSLQAEVMAAQHRNG